MEIRKGLDLPTTFPTGKEIIDRLIHMGLASCLPVEVHGEPSKDSPSKEFILFGIRESREPEIEPVELLQAYNQKGVICFFSALSYYDLTTQVPVHHHIASLIHPTGTANVDAREPSSTSPDREIEPGRSRLGTHAFTYMGVPFYSIKRAANTIPGIKTRIVSGRTNIRISTVEQTLLDTLQYPLHCGGPEVVFEAWKRYSGQLDEDLMSDYLRRIKIDPLIRRAGAMLDLLGHSPGKNLRSFLEESRDRIFGLEEVPTIPLLRGINLPRPDRSWNVLTP
ncbi:MAG: hypothetical protein AB1346_05845 [Thermodesulfobacteriota bacterium]